MDAFNPSPDMTYTRLGTYQLIKVIGKGSFARIYLAKHRYLGTAVAVKVLRKQLTQEEVSRFLTEARIAARLRHPHIMRVVDFAIEDEVPFLVMDYAPYGSLQQRHPEGTQLPHTNILSYVRPIASALQYIHDCGYIHRDVKPGNILLDYGHNLLLSDFGIAMSANTLKADRIGTVAYMAPEQINGQPCRASDQYALAVMIYQWLSGALPFEGSAQQIALQHLTTPPPSLCVTLPALAPMVEAVIFKALAKDPHQRFSSVQAFVQALEQACSNYMSPSRHLSQQTEPLSSVRGAQPYGKFMRRRRPPTRSAMRKPQSASPRTQQRRPGRRPPSLWGQIVKTVALGCLLEITMWILLAPFHIGFASPWFLPLSWGFALPPVILFVLRMKEHS